MWLSLAIAWYLVGYLIFTTSATFSVSVYGLWEYAYYFWDKTKDLLLVLAFFYKPIRTDYLKPVFLLIFLRWVWEIISLCTGLSINNPQAVGILFITVTLICLYLLVR